VAAGYGLTPYGIGDWGSENSFVPGVGTLSIQSQPPIVQTGIIPSGGAVLIGSAPVVVVIERVKTPGTGVLGFVGELPQLRVDFFATPAANDAVITGHAPSLAFSSVSQTFTGAASLAGVVPTGSVNAVRIPQALSLSLVGENSNNIHTEHWVFNLRYLKLAQGL
jgi:hypothetical protein